MNRLFVSRVADERRHAHHQAGELLQPDVALEPAGRETVLLKKNFVREIYTSTVKTLNQAKHRCTRGMYP